MIVTLLVLTFIVIIISIPSSPHSFIPGLKPSFSANPSHHSLPFLQDRLHGFPRLLNDTSEYIRILLFSFSTFWSLVPCSRLSWLLSPFDCMLKQHLVSYCTIVHNCQHTQHGTEEFWLSYLVTTNLAPMLSTGGEGVPVDKLRLLLGMHIISVNKPSTLQPRLGNKWHPSSTWVEYHLSHAAKCNKSTKLGEIISNILTLYLAHGSWNYAIIIIIVPYVIMHTHNFALN